MNEINNYLTLTLDTLTAFHPWLPWVLLTLLIWLAQWAIRKWIPGVWERAADLPFPGVDLRPAVKFARKAWQGLPSVLVGALLGASVFGDDPEQAWLGALSGALAPVFHEILKAFGVYRGGNPPAAKKPESKEENNA